MSCCLGIEIGGTKLQLALGAGTGEQFRALHREAIEPLHGAPRLRDQILAAVPQLLQQIGYKPTDLCGAGIGFGGPVDTHNGMTVTSHQVHGWDRFPLASWLQAELGCPAVLHNDADTAAFAEASFGAGQGYNPMLYVTVGSGIGGGMVLDGQIYRGGGAGAVEIGHLRPGLPVKYPHPEEATVERIASGFGLELRARYALHNQPELQTRAATLLQLAGGDFETVTGKQISAAAAEGDVFSRELLDDATEVLGWGLAQAITLLNPARIVIGGGVSLIGEELFFEPVRKAVARYVFAPFAGLADIVPAGLGEEVVIHGALALARDRFAAA